MKVKYSFLALLVLSFLLVFSWVSFASNVENDFMKQLALAKNIAESKEIIGDMGQDFAYIEGSPKTGITIIHHLGTASRTKYKVITPLIDIKSDSIYIDCTYFKSIDNHDSSEGISVGGYCRSKSEATPEFLENEGKLGNSGITYSSSMPWLKELRKTVDCKNPSGLIYANYYFVRCQNGDDDELTENVTITVFSASFDKLLSVAGYEFAPVKADAMPNKFIFWAIKKESTHEVVEINVPTK